MSVSNLEEYDVTLEQTLTREGDEEVVMWVASADAIEDKLGGETASDALRHLADVLEGE